MKQLYSAILLTVVMAMSASAQTPETMTLADIISQGTLSEFYTIEDDLVAVYCPPHYPRAIFAKDANGYGNKSHPTTAQFLAGKLYDEKEGHFELSEPDAWGERDSIWVGSFDQSNWVKIVLPEGEEGFNYVGHVIKGGTVTGRINNQNYPCDPLGLSIMVEEMPEMGQSAGYTPNLYCTGNFVRQEDWYLVKPQNQEYANIRWAVWHAADTMFYAPQNNSGLPGSFKIKMSLWEPQPNISPFEVFQDGFQYEFPAMIEFRLGVTFVVNIDPGFDGDITIFYGPRHMPVTDNPGIIPIYTDPDGKIYPYTVRVYPLRLESPGEYTGIEEHVDVTRTVASTRYIDLQGRVSDTPHDGLNIVLTTYSDGTTSSYKMIKPNN